MTKTSALILISILNAVGGSAVAQDISGRVGLASEYTGKGLGKSDGEPALSGAVAWSFGDFYAEAFASDAASSRGADAEVIATVGYQRELAGAEFEVQVMYREMLGETPGFDSGYWEYQADVSRKFGKRFSGRFRVNYSNDGYGASKEAWWIEGQAGVKLTAKDKLTAAYGLRRLDGGADYDAWNVGVKHAVTDALALDLRWYDTDAHTLGERYEDRLVAAVTYSF